MGTSSPMLPNSQVPGNKKGKFIEVFHMLDGRFLVNGGKGKVGTATLFL